MEEVRVRQYEGERGNLKFDFFFENGNSSKTATVLWFVQKKYKKSTKRNCYVNGNR